MATKESFEPRLIKSVKEPYKKTWKTADFHSAFIADEDYKVQNSILTTSQDLDNKHST